MSEQPVTMEGLPKFDLADKMRKSLRHAHISVEEMADELDVSRTSISNWINGRVEPSAHTVMAWALRTGIPYTWYCHGDLRPCDYEPVSAASSQVGRRVNKMQRKPSVYGQVNQAG